MSEVEVKQWGESGCEWLGGEGGGSRGVCLPCLPWRVTRNLQNVSCAWSGLPSKPAQPPPQFCETNQLSVGLDFETPSSLIQDEVLKYLGLEQAAGRYLEEMMTKLGSTASQRSLATPKHPIIIWTHLESSQYDEEANLWFIIMILLLALRDFSSKRWITTSQPIRCAKRFAANFCKIVLSVGFYRLLCNCNQYHNVNRWW